jgi:methyl-accepting chemotaxis protein
MSKRGVEVAVLTLEKTEALETLQIIEIERESISITDYIRKPIILSPDQLNKDVRILMEAASGECAVVCEDHLKPIGLVMKDLLFRHLGKTFGVSLYYNQPVAKLMDRNSLIIDKSVPLQQIIDQALNRAEAVLYDCIIITDRDKLEGIVTVGDLLQISRILQKEAVAAQIQTVVQTRQMVAKIDDSVKQVTLSSVHGKSVSESMMQTTSEGNLHLTSVLAAFGRYAGLTAQQENQIRELEKSMHSAKGILEEIRELADQLNLLSVNASIEAARARDNGKGFGVVVNEVKKLATRTKLYAEEVQDNIKHIGNSVVQTVSLVEAGRKETD